MNLLKRLTLRRQATVRVRPIEPLPYLALPPIHEPVQSLEIFASPSPQLDPIPLGISRDGNTVFWEPDRRGAGLLLLGQTGNGTTVLTKSIAEQCRTRGWQLIIADGKGIDFHGYKECANVSYLGLPRTGLRAADEYQCLEALVITHRILTARLHRRATRAPDDQTGFTPVLLVLNEFAGLMTKWASELSSEHLRQILTMVEDLLQLGGSLRCHVLLAPASGWRWKVPEAWNTLCTTVFLGGPSKRDAMRFANPDAVLQAGEQMPRERKGLAMLVTPGAPDADINVLQTFWTYSPGEEIGRPRLPAGVADHWKQFKELVSDPVRALYPKLRIERREIAQGDTGESAVAELLSMPLVIEERPT